MQHHSKQNLNLEICPFRVQKAELGTWAPEGDPVSKPNKIVKGILLDARERGKWKINGK